MSSLEDLQEYVVTQKKLLEELANLEAKDFETKKDYIVRLKEVTRPLFEAGYYKDKKLSDLSSFIYHELLEKHNISYPANQAYYSLFEDDEKRPYGQILPKVEKENSPLPVKDVTGNEDIDNLKWIERNGFELPNNVFSKYFKLIVETTGETQKQILSILKKYGNAFAYEQTFDKTYPDKKELEETIAILTGKKKKEIQERYDYYKKSQEIIYNIENAVDDIIGRSEKLNEILAEQKHTSKILDERNKITFIQKWNAIICSKLDGLGVSAVAKALGIDKKHMTNNIIPANNPVTGSRNRHHDYISWFRAIKITTPNGENLVFDAKDYFDRQIERGKLSLPFERLVLKTCEAVS